MRTLSPDCLIEAPIATPEKISQKPSKEKPENIIDCGVILKIVIIVKKRRTARYSNDNA